MQCTLPVHHTTLTIVCLLRSRSWENDEEFAVFDELVLTDLPYMIRRTRDEENRDIFASDLKLGLSRTCGEILSPEAHVHIFCSLLQFGMW